MHFISENGLNDAVGAIKQQIDLGPLPAGSLFGRCKTPACGFLQIKGLHMNTGG